MTAGDVIRTNPRKGTKVYKDSKVTLMVSEGIVTLNFPDEGTPLDQVSRLLQEAAETHHRVYRIVDGADADWASWYADWLVNLSELPTLLDATPVRSELTYLLVSLDKDYAARQPGPPWETYYAQRIMSHFSVRDS
jgi:hypothetical protein